MAFSTLRDDEFYYGRRQLIDYDRTAQPTYGYEPLTPADFLDPQEHDTFNHGPRHDADVRRLYAVFWQHYRANPLVAVFTGVKIKWADAELPQPVPDVVVVPGAEEWAVKRVVLDVAAEGVAPTLILEVLSPRFVDADLVEKRRIYAQAGVQEYFIVDSGEREESATVAYRVIGYRLVEGAYTAIEPESDGRLYSEVARLWLLPDENEQQIVAISKRTGQPIEPDPNSLIDPASARAEATFRANSIAAQLNFGES
ncbi:MAG: Uma2 family endonuclease [Caldilineaceae bacterium]|nr:Uma2 family endonuclease [Caldilineaceae bacterium]